MQIYYINNRNAIYVFIKNINLIKVTLLRHLLDKLRRRHAILGLEAAAEIAHIVEAARIGGLRHIATVTKKFIAPLEPDFSDKFVARHARKALYLAIEGRMTHIQGLP